ncbi:hypothetical protein [Thalassotalea sediminis]|uniref:hypothetical protein n=1 Tax=Thalassotalea sediminis TaxID=1759089 RepID=UPI002572AFDA|nr:hypothetical protein [Thalassotalea sediminis]
MKKVVLGLSLALATTAANAISDNAKFIAQDSSVETNLCVTAATKGFAAAKYQALKIDSLSPHTFSLTSCNGMSIKKFAKQFSKVTVVVDRTVKAVPADRSFESRLCARAANFGLVALASESKYALRNVSCNGQNIVDFAKAHNS